MAAQPPCPSLRAGKAPVVRHQWNGTTLLSSLCSRHCIAHSTAKKGGVPEKKIGVLYVNSLAQEEARRTMELGPQGKGIGLTVAAGSHVQARLTDLAIGETVILLALPRPPELH